MVQLVNDPNTPDKLLRKETKNLATPRRFQNATQLQDHFPQVINLDSCNRCSILYRQVQQLQQRRFESLSYRLFRLLQHLCAWLGSIKSEAPTPRTRMAKLHQILRILPLHTSPLIWSRPVCGSMASTFFLPGTYGHSEAAVSRFYSLFFPSQHAFASSPEHIVANFQSS
jgi:hypothetical protein